MIFCKAYYTLFSHDDLVWNTIKSPYWESKLQLSRWKDRCPKVAQSTTAKFQEYLTPFFLLYNILCLMLPPHIHSQKCSSCCESAASLILWCLAVIKLISGPFTLLLQLDDNKSASNVNMMLTGLIQLIVKTFYPTSLMHVHVMPLWLCLNEYKAQLNCIWYNLTSCHYDLVSSPGVIWLWNAADSYILEEWHCFLRRSKYFCNR